MKKTGYAKICIMVLLLVGLWIGLTRTEKRESSDAVIRWVPARHTVEKADPQPHSPNVKRGKKPEQAEGKKACPDVTRPDKEQKAEKVFYGNPHQAGPSYTWPESASFLFRRPQKFNPLSDTKR